MVAVSVSFDGNHKARSSFKALSGVQDIWKSILSQKRKRDFFQTVAVLLTLCGCINWATKKLGWNFKRKLYTVLKKSCKENPWKQLIRFPVYSHTCSHQGWPTSFMWTLNVDKRFYWGWYSIATDGESMSPGNPCHYLDLHIYICIYIYIYI